MALDAASETSLTPSPKREGEQTSAPIQRRPLVVHDHLDHTRRTAKANDGDVVELRVASTCVWTAWTILAPSSLAVRFGMSWTPWPLFAPPSSMKRLAVGRLSILDAIRIDDQTIAFAQRHRVGRVFVPGTQPTGKSPVCFWKTFSSFFVCWR